MTLVEAACKGATMGSPFEILSPGEEARSGIVRLRAASEKTTGMTQEKGPKVQYNGGPGRLSLSKVGVGRAGFKNLKQPAKNNSSESQEARKEKRKSYSRLSPQGIPLQACIILNVLVYS